MSIHFNWKQKAAMLSRYDVCPLLKGGWAVRVMTASVMLMMAVLAPTNLVRSYAAPLPDDESVTAIVELADLTDERTARSNRPDKYRLADIMAEELLEKAWAEEPAVTAALQTLEKGGVRLEGLENRLKGKESLVRKLLADAEAEEVSLAQAAAGIGDVLRYTVVIDEGSYDEEVPEALQKLEACGFRVVKFRNAWGGKFYQGINAQLLSPNGERVEVQFHTAQSYDIKQASHKVYEIRRSPQSAPEQVAEATRKSLAYNAQVKVPAGAENIVWPLPGEKVA